MPPLTREDTITTGDLCVFWKQNNADYRGIPLSVLLQYMQDNLTFTPSGNTMTVQYAAPSATGFSVTIQSGVDVHLVLTPTAGFAAGTIVLPPLASLVDRREIVVNTTQQVTTLTIDKNGAGAVTGAPVTLGADDFFRLKYDEFTSTWYRIG